MNISANFYANTQHELIIDITIIRPRSKTIVNSHSKNVKYDFLFNVITAIYDTLPYFFFPQSFFMVADIILHISSSNFLGCCINLVNMFYIYFFLYILDVWITVSKQNRMIMITPIVSTCLRYYFMMDCN